MPDLLNSTCELDNTKQRRYLAELTIPEESELLAHNPCGGLGEKYPGIDVLQLIRSSRIYHPCRDKIAIRPDDTLLAKGSPNDLMQLLTDKVAVPPPMQNGTEFRNPQEAVVVELIIPPQSQLVGRRIRDSVLLRHSDLHILAVERSGLHYNEMQIHNIRLRTGDILLVWCQEDKLDQMREQSEWIMVDDVQRDIEHKAKAPLTGIIFAAVVIAAASGWVNIMVAAMAGVFLMMITRCLPMREAYGALQGHVLMLIAGTIALGTAMDKTGASAHYANLFLSALDGWSPHAVLCGMILLTSISTQLLSNNATAVLLLPIAISTATGLGVDPKPFIIAVCFGASACFATPIGYQTNLMVFSVGGYRFADFLRIGIPLTLLVGAITVLLTPLIWPF